MSFRNKYVQLIVWSGYYLYGGKLFKCFAKGLLMFIKCKVHFPNALIHKGPHNVNSGFCPHLQGFKESEVLWPSCGHVQPTNYAQRLYVLTAHVGKHLLMQTPSAI